MQLRKDRAVAVPADVVEHRNGVCNSTGQIPQFLQCEAVLAHLRHHLVAIQLHGLVRHSGCTQHRRRPAKGQDCPVRILFRQLRERTVELPVRVLQLHGILRCRGVRACVLGIVADLQPVLPCRVLRLAEYRAHAARLLQVSVAPPQDVAQLIVRQGDTPEALKAYAVEHVDEQALYLLPPRSPLGVAEVRALCQRRKIFLRSRAHVPPVSLPCHRVDGLAYLLRSVAIHVVEERVEMAAEQLPQAVVCHGLVKQRLHGIRRARVVRDDDGNLSRPAVVEALGTRPLALQRRSVGHNLHIAEVQLLRQRPHGLRHPLAFTLCKRPLLTPRPPAASCPPCRRVVLKANLGIGICALALAIQTVILSILACAFQTPRT